MRDFFRPISALSPEDRTEFLDYSLEHARTWTPPSLTIGAIAFSSFLFFDMVCLPQLWKPFLLIRIFVVVTGMSYVWAIWTRRVRFGVHSKVILCILPLWGVSLMVTQVPKDFFVAETSTEVLLILATASLYPWLPHEFLIYAIFAFVGSAAMWHSFGDFTVSELTLEYFVFLTALGSSVLTVYIQANQSIQVFKANKKVVRHEMAKIESKIGAIESRLAESDRNAYLAHHLGLFLHEIKNILLSLDVIADSDLREPEDMNQILGSIKNSSDLARKRIEAFLVKINLRSTSRQILSVGHELQTVMPIMYHDGKKNNIKIEIDVPRDLNDFQVFAVPGAVSVVLFDIMRNAVNAIAEARRKYPGPTFLGIISMEVKITGHDAVFRVEDNGIGISQQQSEAFSTGQAIDSTSSERLGLGTLGMRREASENKFQVSLEPRLGGGTVATLIVSRYELHDQTDFSEERKLA